jgi:hypothetical protein
MVTLSTTEAETIAAVETGKEICWLRNFLSELDMLPTEPSPMAMDNQSAISVAKHPEHHGRMKHLDLRWFWLREKVQEGKITPKFVPTDEMPADVLTKPLSRDLVDKFRRMMGLEGEWSSSDVVLRTSSGGSVRGNDAITVT